jgi:NADPH2:quinone reductase
VFQVREPARSVQPASPSSERSPARDLLSHPGMTTLPEGQHVVVSEYGETPLEAIDGFTTLQPMPAPQPSAREVVVAIRSASVGWVDLLMTSGQYQHMVRPPYTPGMEYAGVVADKGSDVSDLEVGQEVLVDPFFAGPRSLGEYQRWGGWASYALAPREAILRIPGGLSLDQAANLLGNYETAYHCIVHRGRVQAGETVLVLGASGATGLAAVEVAKLRGATVIALGRSDAKLAVVRAHGADHVICTSGSFKDEVKALTDGRGVDVVYDGVGGEASVESLRCVKFGARFLIVGWASTPFVAKGKGGRGAPNVNVLPTNLILMKSIDVLGCPTAIATAQDPSIRAPRLSQVLAWAEEGKLRPHVSHVFALADYKTAARAKWSGEVIGGCVLRV